MTWLARAGSGGRSAARSPRCSTGGRASPGGALDVVFTWMLDWVADKPWELAFDPSRREFLATSSVNFARNAHTAVPADSKARRRGRLRGLVVVSRPRGSEPLH